MLLTEELDAISAFNVHDIRDNCIRAPNVWILLIWEFDAFSGLVVAESSYARVSDGHVTNSYSRECQANLFKASISSIILPRRVRLRFHMSSRVTLG